MIPFNFMGGSQDTKTVEAEAEAALTPAGGPGTERPKRTVVNVGKINQCISSCIVWQTKPNKNGLLNSATIRSQ